MAVYKSGRGFELGTLPRTNPASGQGQTWNSEPLNYKSSTLTMTFIIKGLMLFLLPRKGICQKMLWGDLKKNYAHSASPLVHLMHVAKCYLLLQVIGN